MLRSQQHDSWAVVLAGGEGQRLAPLTRALYGQALPKQFAVLNGGRSLLQLTLDRLRPLFPPRRTVVVVGRAHEAVAADQLRDQPDIELVLQPKNLDTAPGILLPLARIQRRDPEAVVSIFPSDHQVTCPTPFLTAASRAMAAARRSGERLVLLGAVPEYAETEYGWVYPEPCAGTVEAPFAWRFVEKPDPIRTRQLLTSGGLWNTFVTTARLETFWSLARTHIPRHASLFECYARHAGRAEERHVLESLYATLSPANFSRAILERTDKLAVIPVDGSGWCDLGSPARVHRWLERSDTLPMPVLNPLSEAPSIEAIARAVRTLRTRNERSMNTGLASDASGAEPSLDPHLRHRGTATPVA